MKITELFDSMPADEEACSTPSMEQDADAGEYDREGEMAKIQLRIICDASQELHELLHDEDNLPEWVQSKLTLAQDYIVTIKDYLKAKDHAA